MEHYAISGNPSLMFTQAGFVQVSGARLYYEVAGSGQPLALIHGLGLDLRMWDDQFTTFAQRFQVIRYDVRGFGKSTMPPTEKYSHADDLKALLDHLNISQATIMGLSMGGGIAANFVLTYPAMARVLILVDSALNGYEMSPEWNAQWQEIKLAGANHGPKAANQLWLAHPLFAPARENPVVAARLEQMIADYSGWHWVNRDPQRRIEPPDCQRLEQIKVPTLILIGQRDLPDFHSMSATLQQHIPGASMTVLAEAGHMANMEGPALLNQLVENFLRAI